MVEHYLLCIFSPKNKLDRLGNRKYFMLLRFSIKCIDFRSQISVQLIILYLPCANPLLIVVVLSSILRYWNKN